MQFYSAGTSAQYTNGLTVTLPSLGASALYEVVGGAWQQIPTTSDGSNLTATLDQLGTLALGNPVPAVHAAFTVSGDGAQAPATVGFDASNSTVDTGSIASYSWDFGDGSTGSGPTAGHVYDASGTYTVTLTTTSDQGATDTLSHTVTVLDSPPLAAAQFPATATVGVPVSGFDASASRAADGPVAEVDWDFGDGSDPTTGATASHTFTQPGAYTVTADVWDDEGGMNSTSATVVVSAPPASFPGPSQLSPSPTPPSSSHTVPRLSLLAPFVLDSRSHLVIRLRCAAHTGPCRGTVTVSVHTGRKLRRAASHSYSLAAGRTGAVTLSLPGWLVTALRRHRQSLVIAVTVRGAATQTMSRPPRVLPIRRKHGSGSR